MSHQRNMNKPTSQWDTTPKKRTPRMNDIFEKRLRLQYGSRSTNISNSGGSPLSSKFSFTLQNSVFQESTLNQSPGCSSTSEIKETSQYFNIGLSPYEKYSIHHSFTKSPQSLSKGRSVNKSATPSKEIIGDRCIPMRTVEEWNLKFPYIPNDTDTLNSRKNSAKSPKAITKKDTRNRNETYECLLKNEILNMEIKDDRETCVTPPAMRNLFQYSSPSKTTRVSPLSVYPVSANSENLLRCPSKKIRKIPKAPFKVLDAPDLQDDFYLNLVDWSVQNVLGVGLGPSVYLWSANTSNITRLLTVDANSGNSVTSVNWNGQGTCVAVGTHQGFIEVWDTVAQKRISCLRSHLGRIGTLAWNGNIVSSGSRDRTIAQNDIRVPHGPVKKLLRHSQEVCGLKWSPDLEQLASGGNDNRLCIWDVRSPVPVQCYSEHCAAVKAIAWSPHQYRLLASGGGTADRKIRFWNTLSSQCMNFVDTASQVCNLAWSKHSQEFVSTHGYSQNQVLIWKYPSLQQVAKLTGHTYRVLYLAMSPCGESIVTGAGDETLRFWNVFQKHHPKAQRSLMDLSTNFR